MTEQEAKRLETKTEWNGKAHVCTHCRRVPETFYVATGHDHTDYDIKWCPCREVKPSAEVAELKRKLTESQAREAKLREAIEFTRQYVGEERLPALPGWSWFDALALPHDDTALKSYRDAVIEECLAEIEQGIWFDKTTGEILESIADAIRNLK